MLCRQLFGIVHPLKCPDLSSERQRPPMSALDTLECTAYPVSKHQVFSSLAFLLMVLTWPASFCPLFWNCYRLAEKEQVLWFLLCYMHRWAHWDSVEKSHRGILAALSTREGGLLGRGLRIGVRNGKIFFSRNCQWCVCRGGILDFSSSWMVLGNKGMNWKQEKSSWVGVFSVWWYQTSFTSLCRNRNLPVPNSKRLPFWLPHGSYFI